MHTNLNVLAQSFTASQPFILDGVELLLDGFHTQVTAYLQDDATGAPGFIYAVGYTNFAGPGFIYFDFAPVTIMPGTSYHIRIDGDAGWYYGDQDLYEGGQQAFINNVIWVNDFIFRTCSEPVAVEPETWGVIKSRY
jgi:hypothetical protein